MASEDVKPENFLFGDKNGYQLKICDFGLALKQPKNGKLTGVGGTAPYMAPETLVVPKGLRSKPSFHKEAPTCFRCFFAWGLRSLLLFESHVMSVCAL